MKKKNIIILGSTGSIGKSSLDVIRRNKEAFRVVGLAANRNADLMAPTSERVLASGRGP